MEIKFILALCFGFFVVGLWLGYILGFKSAGKRFNEGVKARLEMESMFHDHIKEK